MRKILSFILFLILSFVCLVSFNDVKTFAKSNITEDDFWEVNNYYNLIISPLNFQFDQGAYIDGAVYYGNTMIYTFSLFDIGVQDPPKLLVSGDSDYEYTVTNFDNFDFRKEILFILNDNFVHEEENILIFDHCYFKFIDYDFFSYNIFEDSYVNFDFVPYKETIFTKDYNSNFDTSFVFNRDIDVNGINKKAGSILTDEDLVSLSCGLIDVSSVSVINDFNNSDINIKDLSNYVLLKGDDFFNTYLLFNEKSNFVENENYEIMKIEDDQALLFKYSNVYNDKLLNFSIVDESGTIISSFDYLCSSFDEVKLDLSEFLSDYYFYNPGSYFNDFLFLKTNFRKNISYYLDNSNTNSINLKNAILELNYDYDLSSTNSIKLFEYNFEAFIYTVSLTENLASGNFNLIYSDDSGIIYNEVLKEDVKAGDSINLIDILPASATFRTNSSENCSIVVSNDYYTSELDVLDYDTPGAYTYSFDNFPTLNIYTLGGNYNLSYYFPDWSDLKFMFVGCGLNQLHYFRIYDFSNTLVGFLELDYDQFVSLENLKVGNLYSFEHFVDEPSDLTHSIFYLKDYELKQNEDLTDNIDRYWQHKYNYAFDSRIRLYDQSRDLPYISNQGKVIDYNEVFYMLQGDCNTLINPIFINSEGNSSYRSYTELKFLLTDLFNGDFTLTIPNILTATFAPDSNNVDVVYHNELYEDIIIFGDPYIYPYSDNSTSLVCSVDISSDVVDLNKFNFYVSSNSDGYGVNVVAEDNLAYDWVSAEVYSVTFVQNINGEYYSETFDFPIYSKLFIPSHLLNVPGYSFKGINLNGNYNSFITDWENIVIEEDKVYYLIFSSELYELKINVNDKIYSYFYLANESFSHLDPVVPGYTFNGYYSDPSFKHLYEFDSMPASSLILYAKMIPVIYNVNYYIPSELLDIVTTDEFVFVKKDEYKFGESINYLDLSSYLNTDELKYLYNGWYDLDDNLVTLFTMPSNDLNLYIIKVNESYVPETQVYTITFVGTNFSTIYTDGTIPELPEPSLKGHTFVGWYFDEEYINIVTPGEYIPSNLKLYPKYNPIDCEIKIYLSLEDYQAGNLYYSCSGKYGSNPKLPVPVYLDKTFLGYKTLESDHLIRQISSYSEEEEIYLCSFSDISSDLVVDADDTADNNNFFDSLDNKTLVIVAVVGIFALLGLASIFRKR